MSNVTTPQLAANLVSSVVNQAIVRPLGDPYVIGVSGLILDIIDDVEVLIDSDITDHYVEQNYAIQDHIALKPIRVTLHGYAAEQVNVFSPSVFATIFNTITGLVALGGLGPNFNTQDQEFYNVLNNTSQLGSNVVNAATSIFSLFNNAATLVTRQQSVYQFLYNMWQTRQLCTVETPYVIFQNMAIESIRATQPGASTLISEFIVTFKQILTVASIQGTTSVDSTQSQNTGSTSNAIPQAGGSFGSMVAAPVNLGQTAGIDNLPASQVQLSVANTSQTTYVQQIAPPNTY